MSLTKLSLVGINLIIPGLGEHVRDISAGDEKILYLFSQCTAVVSAVHYSLSYPAREYLFAVRVQSSRYYLPPCLPIESERALGVLCQSVDLGL
jgi:hypothetical protein